MFKPVGFKTPGVPRQCGACSACCTTQGVVEFDKATNEPCKHQKFGGNCAAAGGGGCGIYETRPQGCREWECCWLSGLLSEKHRPDQSGIVFEFSSPTHLHAYLLRPDVPEERVEFLFQKIKAMAGPGQFFELEV